MGLSGQAAVLAGLLLDGGAEPLPDWKHEPTEFARELTRRASAAGNAFDGRLRRMVPLVDPRGLLQAVRGSRGDWRLIIVPMIVVLLGWILPSILNSGNHPLEAL